MNDEEIEKHIENFEVNKFMSNISGGTVASMMLRNALRLRSYNPRPDLDRRLDAIAQDWREALKRHNSQPKRLITYDIETGNPIDED